MNLHETPSARLHLRSLQTEQRSTLLEDVRDGLSQSPKTLPAKYFYDAHGSELFDRICETPEYYQTRTELALLERVAPPLLESLRPTDVIELGSGAAKKTHALLDAAERAGLPCRYAPFDVSESMLRASAERLLRRYPWLQIEALVGDYDRHLHLLGGGERRLFVFLGSTIGNFTQDAAVAFLAQLARTMGAGDRLLLGTDLVKDRLTLDEAYNDAAGWTAAFNKNVLSVLNRELGAEFRLSEFHHRAFFNAAESQVEMHLEAAKNLEVPIAALERCLQLAAGERIRTEISRKFTPESAQALLHGAGMSSCGWWTPADQAFGLSLARVTRQ